MVEGNGAAENILSVPVETTAFLAAVSAFAVFLLVIFVYVNKKWRLLNVGFSTVGKSSALRNSSSSGTSSGISSTPKIQHELLSKGNQSFRSPLGEIYAMSPPESSSDSEEDVLRRLRHQMSLEHGNTGSTMTGRGSPFHQSVRSYSLDQQQSHYSQQQQGQNPPQQQYHSNHHQGHGHGGLITQRSFDLSHHPLHQSTPSSNAAVPQSSSQQLLHHHQHHPHASSSSSSTFTNIRPLRVTSIRDIDNVSCNSSSRRRSKGLMNSTSMGTRAGGDGGDLISLAEKGKVNGGSSASSTSSNVSAEDDPNHHHHHQMQIQHHQGALMRAHQQQHHHQLSQRAEQNSRPVSVSSNATTLVATPQPHSSHQQQPPPLHHNQSQLSHHPPSHSAQNITNSSVSSSCNSNFRRMMPPRTKSIDSESPPPSEQGLSTYGDSIADQDDHIFEVEEMSLVEGHLGMVVEPGRGPTSPTQCGSIEVAFDYEAAARKMTVHVIQARGVPHKDIGGANNSQIRLVLLPERKQKQKTKVRPGEDPSFMETFVFNKINPEDVSSLGVRFRLYGCERMRRERLLGECVLGFGSLHLEMETTIWLNFEPRYHLSWDSRSESGSLARSDSASSTASIQSGIPELLVGLAYNGTTGRLTVEIIKGSHFRQLAGGRAPDSYIKLVLVSCSGQEMGRAKTSLRRAQSNPLFKETFMFQVALFQIQEVTLLVSVYGRKGVTRRELLGWFALGYNSSGDEETTHWEDMCDAQGDQMCRWHVLQS